CLAREQVPPLDPVPTEVRAGAPAPGHEVDLLPLVLTDVGDPQVAGLAIPGEPPRVAEPVGPDLGQPAAPGERIVGRDRVLAAGGRPRVDPQDLAQHRVERLPVAALCVAAALVAGSTAVAEAEIQHPVGTEAQLPAVVVR